VELVTVFSLVVVGAYLVRLANEKCCS
jgi:hypothetical protein